MSFCLWRRLEFCPSYTLKVIIHCSCTVALHSSRYKSRVGGVLFCMPGNSDFLTLQFIAVHVFAWMCWKIWHVFETRAINKRSSQVYLVVSSVLNKVWYSWSVLYLCCHDWYTGYMLNCFRCTALFQCLWSNIMKGQACAVPPTQTRAHTHTQKIWLLNDLIL